MSKILVLAEKPSVGRDIAKVLNCKNKQNGFFEGEKYVVTWALGHLVTLADPEEYDKKYKAWKMEDLPMLPEKLKLVVIKQTQGQFKTVKEQMLRKDVTEIVVATDAGREGELVARWIIDKAKIKKPIKRLWISSVTDLAIKQGFANLKDGKEYEGLYASAEARAAADWLVGINATRALTCKFNAQLSCGRVQTPTLAIIAMREREIQNFEPQTFFGIQLKVSTGNKADKDFKLTWKDKKSNSTRSFDRVRIEKLVNSFKSAGVCNVTEVKRTIKKQHAPGLYDLTELQRDANKKYDYSAKETLGFMQALYERHKVLTYPRTDSRYIGEDIVPTLKDRLKSCSVGNFSKFTQAILKNPIKTNKSFVDGKKVSDHHAIIPTEQTVILSDMSQGERRIHELVVKRFLAVLYPEFEYEQITVTAEVSGEIFVAKGRNIKKKGWKEVYESSSENDEAEEDEEDGLKEQTMPELKEGQALKIMSADETSGKTRPPAPFNEATLLTAMENPAKYMADAGKDLIKTINQTTGLGTVATRADVIEKLFKTFLIEKKGKDIFTTAKGKQLLELVPDELKSPVLTAEWEQKLIAISQSKISKNQFVTEMRKYANVTVSEIKSSDKQFKHDNVTMEKCPECGKFLLEVNGKKGKMLVCPERECGYRKGLSQMSNARCPNCHKKLEIKGQGDGRLFACQCGYREKLSAFEKRKKSEISSANARDVARELASLKKENKNSGNNAFAAALEKFKGGK